MMKDSFISTFMQVPYWVREVFCKSPQKWDITLVQNTDDEMDLSLCVFNCEKDLRCQNVAKCFSNAKVMLQSLKKCLFCDLNEDNKRPTSTEPSTQFARDRDCTFFQTGY